MSDLAPQPEAGEPLFTLYGRDQWASVLVDSWANERELDIDRGLKPQDDLEKVNRAREIAQQMREYFRKRTQ